MRLPAPSLGKIASERRGRASARPFNECAKLTLSAGSGRAASARSAKGAKNSQKRKRSAGFAGRKRAGSGKDGGYSEAAVCVHKFAPIPRALVPEERTVLPAPAGVPVSPTGAAVVRGEDHYRVFLGSRGADRIPNFADVTVYFLDYRRPELAGKCVRSLRLQIPVRGNFAETPKLSMPRGMCGRTVA